MGERGFEAVTWQNLAEAVKWDLRGDRQNWYWVSINWCYRADADRDSLHGDRRPGRTVICWQLVFDMAEPTES
jgi:hypothetical protein